MQKRDFLKALGATLALPAVDALAQPIAGGAPIKVIVPLPAGSSNDHVTRVLAPYMSSTLGQNIVIDNKVGGNGVIGAMEVVRARPDGSTLLCGSLSPLAVNVATVKDLPYDPLKDFTPIAATSLTNHVLMVKADSPIQTLADFIAYAKARPGKVSVGYSTTTVQVQIATINKQAGIQLLGVPYRGSPATLVDVAGGVLDATLTDPGNALTQVRAGRMRALGVSSLKRNPTTPDWPAISETLPGYDFPSWNAFVGPAGMSRDLVNRIADAAIKGLKQKEIAEKYASSGTIPMIMGPDELKAFMEAEVAKWVRLAREANIQPS
jgi:tripartite-type tricarboxylate transporter receptor subunit TctC